MDRNGQIPMPDEGNAPNVDYGGVVLSRDMLQNLMERNALIMRQSANAYNEAREIYNWAAVALEQFDAANQAAAMVQEDAAQAVDAIAEPVAAAPQQEPALQAQIPIGAVEVAKPKEEPAEVEGVGQEPGNNATKPTAPTPRRSLRLVEKQIKKKQQ